MQGQLLPLVHSDHMKSTVAKLFNPQLQEGPQGALFWIHLLQNSSDRRNMDMLIEHCILIT